ncbi:hypothetical protein [Dysgonomonas sp. ZJ279]|uniref:hypothetical protein n=1 Tax=Dysgonomonas sp. ZJ279 TaxID=2709796 RepID=UPI0013EBE0E5|nr:hypothetical protein [Dysgonomonas sp. ZJ279]
MKKINEITFDQTVMINSILGYVDFIGETEIILVDTSNIKHTIKIFEIEEVYSNEIVHFYDLSVHKVENST